MARATGGAPLNGPAGMSTAVLEALRGSLLSAFEPQALEIRDDSAAHAGHAGARDGGHFSVRIVASRFAGRGLLERHRLVYTAVAGLMQNGVHALSIDARTPEEVS